MGKPWEKGGEVDEEQEEQEEQGDQQGAGAPAKGDKKKTSKKKATKKTAAKRGRPAGSKSKGGRKVSMKIPETAEILSAVAAIRGHLEAQVEALPVGIAVEITDADAIRHAILSVAGQIE